MVHGLSHWVPDRWYKFRADKAKKQLKKAVGKLEDLYYDDKLQMDTGVLRGEIIVIGNDKFTADALYREGKFKEARRLYRDCAETAETLVSNEDSYKLRARNARKRLEETVKKLKSLCEKKPLDARNSGYLEVLREISGSADDDYKRGDYGHAERLYKRCAGLTRKMISSINDSRKKEPDEDWSPVRIDNRPNRPSYRRK